MSCGDMLYADSGARNYTHPDSEDPETTCTWCGREAEVETNEDGLCEECVEEFRCEGLEAAYVEDALYGEPD